VQATSSFNPKAQTAIKAISSNIFQPIATGAPPKQFPWKPQYFVQRNKLIGGTVLQTNKFYTNLLLGSQKNAIFTHPYSLWFRDCKNGIIPYCGMSISHVDRDRTSYGSGSPARFFINPTGIESIIMSAVELDASTQLLTRNLGAFSINAHLSPGSTIIPVISFPIVQGMGFITASYVNARPIISSGVFFQSLVLPLDQPSKSAGIYKYRLSLEDGTMWLMYVRSIKTMGTPPFVLQGSAKILGPANFSGTIQIAKLPSLDVEYLYDASAGAYVIGTTISATASGNIGTYTMNWASSGIPNRPLLMFALPHHVQCMDRISRLKLTSLQLQTTTKGMATAVLANSITMVEPEMPVAASFAPWSPYRMAPSIPGHALLTIRAAAKAELTQDMVLQTNLTSMYWSGKAFAKFATTIVAAFNTGNNDLATAGLHNLTAAFSIFVNNKQYYPLVYETTWRGLVSSASYATNDVFQDYGNTYYNDHHFHYGYHVYTAAVIAYYDPAWLSMGNNKAWVDSLVRDYANSVETDGFFPFSRSFDWFHGHSWADGLFESGDSKNEESTSEDSFSLYAIKMWGKVTGDSNMEARGNLQLAILRRTLHNYFLMESNNINEPARFIGNKAVGIMFENKIDHTTYFGNNIEYIEGIHMLPMHAVQPYMRSPNFVREEWAAYFSNGRVDQVRDGAWRGILYANLALIDPKTSWNYFSRPGFDLTKLDTGASLTWYLLFAAILGGVPT
jgi:endo-1,3(4)-beta-glucanase